MKILILIPARLTVILAIPSPYFNSPKVSALTEFTLHCIC